MANERIGIRSGTNAQWLAANTTPGTEYEIKNREMIYVSDLRQIKIGDGSSNYTSLPFIQVDHEQVVGLGTSAERDVTTSATDTTEGRVPIIRNTGGIFGLGASVAITPASMLSVTAGGFYRIDGADPDNPSPGAGVVAIQIPGFTSAFAGNIVLTQSGVDPRAFFRAKTTTLTSPWRELHHTGNLPYETGTWTPVLSFGGASVGIVYTAQNGRYQRIGRNLFFTLIIGLSSKGSSTGSAEITLPAVNINQVASFSFRVNAVTFSGIPQAIVLTSTDKIRLETVSTAGTVAVMTDTNIGNTSTIYITGQIEVA